ncbi:TraB/GumN family protein [Microbulbifer guangxiensis]|uniref:TraB/GumN family protein n=1 Tax=Microbulbifer guangxiensis TaxID=2904249 RepID=UPI001F2B08AC|nr:TraB/GumN family protein [Microbulbifer guangxiensis]
MPFPFTDRELSVHSLMTALGLVLLLLLSNGARAAGDQGLFWVAEKGDRRVYLLGSVHLATPDFYPLRGRILEAFEHSDALVVEADILMAERDPVLQQQIMSASLYTGDRTLRDDLSAETYRQLQAWLASRQLPEAIFIRQRPAIAMITLSLMEMQARGLDPKLGIDRHFLQKAHQRGDKKVLELEGVLEQLALLNNLENPDLLLRQTLEQLKDIDTLIPGMMSAWKSGDAEAMHDLVIADELQENPQFASLFEVMFYQRNRNMSARIAEASENHDTLFVIVGAGHLVGEKSVLKKLERHQFHIKAI